MDTEHEALDYYRKLVSFLYREIGVLLPKNHPGAYSKINNGTHFFTNDRKRQAKELYHKSLPLHQPDQIAGIYRERTGLSLEDLLTAFSEGEWRNSKGGYSYGGPRWAAITEHTMNLGLAINNEEWERVPELIGEIRKLRHNNGLIIEKFKELKQ